MLEGSKATTETLDALRSGASAMKAMQKATYVFCRNIHDVDKTMDEISEQTDYMRQIQDALSAPFGSDFDEVNIPFIPTIKYFYQIFSTLSVWGKLQDELEAELEELESAELEEELLEPVRPVQNLPEGKQPARPATQKKQTAYEDELAALQADMAL